MGTGMVVLNASRPGAPLVRTNTYIEAAPFCDSGTYSSSRTGISNPDRRVSRATPAIVSHRTGWSPLSNPSNVTRLPIGS